MILATARAVSDDDFIHRKVILKVMGELAEDGDLGSNPADLYLQCWETACRALGVKDPYENEKARADKTALGVLRIMAERYPFNDATALKIAIKTSFTGAMLDFTGLGRSDVQEKIAGYLQSTPARDDSAVLEEAIDKAKSVMLVANRAGEVTMDRPLLEVMAAAGKEAYLAVAAKPVFLMATEKDAATSEYSESVTIVNPGTAMYGLAQDRASSEFHDLFESVDLVILKGSTHLSTILPVRDMFFMLKVTEAEVAERLGIAMGEGAIIKMDAQE